MYFVFFAPFHQLGWRWVGTRVLHLVLSLIKSVAVLIFKFLIFKSYFCCPSKSLLVFLCFACYRCSNVILYVVADVLPFFSRTQTIWVVSSVFWNTAFILAEPTSDKFISEPLEPENSQESSQPTHVYRCISSHFFNAHHSDPYVNTGIASASYTLT